MTTFYLDTVNGNDANDGTSWALAWKTLSGGATAARIGPNDTIRMAKSPDPISTGQTAVWNGTVPNFTSISISSSTNASPIVVTTSTNHGFSTGNWVQVASHTSNTAANGLWKVTVLSATTFSLDSSVGNATGTAGGTATNASNGVVELTTAVNKTIWNCETAPTAVLGTAAASTNFLRQGGYAMQTTAPASGNATNTKYNYTTLPATLDLSSYQQVSFWQSANGVFAANTWKLCLCSDTLGNTIVHEIPLEANPNTSITFGFTTQKDFGAALSSGIQSIALYSSTTAPTNSQIVYIDNIIAAKAPSEADAITHATLISPDNTNWYPIQSIDGTVIRLMTTPSNSPLNQKGYCETSGTFTLYRRETAKTALQVTSASATSNLLNEAGIRSSSINLEGGWNPATDLRDGHTVLDGRNGAVNGLYIGVAGYWNISGISLTRYLRGVYGANALQITSLKLDLGFISAVSNAAIDFSGASFCRGIRVAVDQIFGGGATPVIVAGVNGHFDIGRLSAPGTTQSNGTAVTVGGMQHIFRIGEIRGCANGFSIATARKVDITCPVVADIVTTAVSLSSASDILIRDTAFTNCGLVTNMSSQATNDLTMVNCSMPALPGVATNSESRFVSQDHNKTPGYHMIVMDGMQIYTQQSTVTRSGGWAWRAQPLDTYTRTETHPATHVLGRVAVAAGSLVTATLKVRRTHALAANIGLDFVCPGGQVAGVPDDVVASASAAADTWETLTISFTPTETRVVELVARSYGVDTYRVFYSDLTVTQA